MPEPKVSGGEGCKGVPAPGTVVAVRTFAAGTFISTLAAEGARPPALIGIAICAAHGKRESAAWPSGSAGGTAKDERAPRSRDLVGRMAAIAIARA